LVTGQLYYESQIAITGVAGALQKYVFSANGAYDPNFTGTGHQMVGFDQMMLFFEQAVVVRSKIQVTFFAAQATTTYDRVAISLSPDTTTTASVDSVIENGLTVTTVLGGALGADGAQSIKTLSLECDIPRYFGRSRSSLVSSPEFYCTASANPTEQVYYHIQTWNPIGATNTQVNIDVMLSFDIYYYEPRKVGSSFWHLAVEALRTHRQLKLGDAGEATTEEEKRPCLIKTMSDGYATAKVCAACNGSGR